MMEYDIEVYDKSATPIGRIKFYDASYEEEEKYYFFHGSFGRIYQGDLDLIVEEVLFEVCITNGKFEWGEGVEPNPVFNKGRSVGRKKSLSPEEQKSLEANLINYKEDYINDFG